MYRYISASSQKEARIYLYVPCFVFAFILSADFFCRYPVFAFCVFICYQ
jgi:hypothetical protein